MTTSTESELIEDFVRSIEAIPSVFSINVNDAGGFTVVEIDPHTHISRTYWYRREEYRLALTRYATRLIRDGRFDVTRTASTCSRIAPDWRLF